MIVNTNMTLGHPYFRGLGGSRGGGGHCLARGLLVISTPANIHSHMTTCVLAYVVSPLPTRNDIQVSRKFRS